MRILILMIGLLAIGCAENPSSIPAATDINENQQILIYQNGDKPTDLMSRRMNWLEVIRDLPKKARVSDIKKQFIDHKNIGIKSLHNLTTETWEIDDAFFITFEISPQDLGRKDPRVVGVPKLYSYTFVDVLPIIDEILDRAQANGNK